MAKKKQNLSLEELMEHALVPEHEWPYRVPENWVWTYWKNCGNLVAGNGFSPKYQGFSGYDIPFYKVGSLKYTDSSGYLYDESNTINEGIRKTLRASLIASNSIIFAKIGEAIRLNRRSLNLEPCCIDNNLMAFMANDTCLFKYAFYWTHQQEFYDLANATTVPAIRKGDLEMLTFPLPPLAEQQRIVDRVESLFEKLDQAKGFIQDALDSFENRKATILRKAFSGELTKKWREENGIGMESWRERKFNEVADIKSNLVDPIQFSDYPHIAPDNIEKRTGKLLPYRSINEDGVTSGKHRFYPGQILYSKIRPYLSKVVLIDIEGLCSADMYPVQAKEDSKYLWYYMLSDEFLTQASSAGSRSVLPKINQKELSEIKINIPSKAEQIEIAKILDTLFEKEELNKSLCDTVKDLDLMKKSILARAFRGELGTNDPEEEGALELLNKILE